MLTTIIAFAVVSSISAYTGWMLRDKMQQRIELETIHHLSKPSPVKPFITGVSHNLVTPIYCDKCGAKSNHAYHTSDGRNFCSEGCAE